MADRVATQIKQNPILALPEFCKASICYLASSHCLLCQWSSWARNWSFLSDNPFIPGVMIPSGGSDQFHTVFKHWMRQVTPPPWGAEQCGNIEDQARMIVFINNTICSQELIRVLVWRYWDLDEWTVVLAEGTRVLIGWIKVVVEWTGVLNEWHYFLFSGPTFLFSGQ